MLSEFFHDNAGQSRLSVGMLPPASPLDHSRRSEPALPSPRIAYATEYDPSELRNWSGNGFYMAAAMEEAGLSLQPIGPLREKWRLLFQARQFGCKAIWRKRHMRDREPQDLRSYAEQVAARVRERNYDLVFSPGTICIANLRTEKPIAFWTDATFGGMVDFYARWTNLCRTSLRNGHAMGATRLAASGSGHLSP